MLIVHISYVVFFAFLAQFLLVGWGGSGDYC